MWLGRRKGGQGARGAELRIILLVLYWGAAVAGMGCNRASSYVQALRRVLTGLNQEF